MKKGLTVCVIGLGRIGLPTALVLADVGYKVYGVDIDKSLLQKLKAGEVPFYEREMAELLKRVSDEFVPTHLLDEAVTKSSVVLICVGTRRFASNNPDLGVLYRVFEDLTSCDIRGKLIILRTTLPLGTTSKIEDFIERKTGLISEQGFYLAYSPERTREGYAIQELRTLPKIVGACGPKARKKAIEFLGTVSKKVVPLENPLEAELVKLIDNTWRITTFAYANDLAHICEKYGLNAFKLIYVANKDYSRNDIPEPSCGVGGYCLTKDPYYLEDAFSSVAKERGLPSIWMNARLSNTYRVIHSANQIEKALLDTGRSIDQSRVVICGIAYKANVDDVRDSHGLLLATELGKRGAEISIWDPWVEKIELPFKLCSNAKEAFVQKDVAAFTVKHTQFKKLSKRIARLTTYMRTPIIFDGAGIFRDITGNPHEYKLIGTGIAHKKN